MKTNQDPTLNRYLTSDYLQKNPEWDFADTGWKAEKVYKILVKNKQNPSSIVEIGCGSGGVLLSLKKFFPKASLTGFDIAPGAKRFWKKAIKAGIRLELADYFSLKEPIPDLILLLDVLEHIANPWSFLTNLHSRSKYIIVHFPLDLSAMSVIREHPLMKVRDKVGHLHFFTRRLAISLLVECGYEVIESCYTKASLTAPQRSLKTKIAGTIRRILFSINHDFGARLLGGETLIVLAHPKSSN